MINRFVTTRDGIIWCIEPLFRPPIRIDRQQMQLGVAPIDPDVLKQEAKERSIADLLVSR